MKFKVGEKINDERYGKGRILKIKDGNSILVEFEKENNSFHDGNGMGQDKHCYWVENGYFIQVIAKPTKEELFKMPIGTIIKTDREYNNVFVKVGENDFCNDAVDHIEYNDVNDDLSLECFGNKIIEIQEPTYNTIHKADEEVREMTIAEIEKELGYPIKVVKEEE